MSLIRDEAVILHFCADHMMEVDLEAVFPEYHFNCAPVFKNLHHCRIDGCKTSAVMSFTGYKTPDKIPDLSLVKKSLPMDEIFNEAFAIMSADCTAIEGLTMYLFHKTRVVEIGQDIQAVLILKRLAELLLQKLNINPSVLLSRVEVHLILKELNVYPVDSGY